MAPTTRSSRQSSPTGVHFGSISIRINRAKSLPGGCAQSLVIVPSETITRFDLGPIIPSNLVLCKACKTPMVKTPPAKASPKTKAPVETSLGEQLEAYLSEARNRNTTIQAAYASASKDFGTLGNPDVSGEHSPIDTKGQLHAPYTKEACTRVGNLMGELGRALDTSLKGIAALEQALEDERKRSQSGDAEQKRSRADWERAWWNKEKQERLENANRSRQKKRKRARR